MVDLGSVSLTANGASVEISIDSEQYATLTADNPPQVVVTESTNSQTYVLQRVLEYDDGGNPIFVYQSVVTMEEAELTQMQVVVTNATTAVAMLLVTDMEAVTANPTDEATDSLTKIKVNDITYQIPTSLEGMYLLDDIVGGTEPVADGTIEIDTTDLGFELAVNTRIQYYWTQEDGSKSLYVYAHVQSVETNAATLYIDNVLNLGAGGGVPVIDLGTLSSFQLGSEASVEATITAEQAEQLASSDYSVLSFTTSDGYKMFVPKMVGSEVEGTALHMFGCILQIESDASWGVLCQVMQTNVSVSGAVIYTTRVVANPSDTATQTLQKLRVRNNVYSIPQGTEVIDLGTAQLTEEYTGEGLYTGEISISQDNYNKLNADGYSVVKINITGGPLNNDTAPMWLSKRMHADGIFLSGSVRIDTIEYYAEVLTGKGAGTGYVSFYEKDVFASDEGSGSGVEIVDLGDVTFTEQGEISVAILTPSAEIIAALAADPKPALSFVTDGMKVVMHNDVSSVMSDGNIPIWFASMIPEPGQFMAFQAVFGDGQIQITLIGYYHLDEIDKRGIPAGGTTGQVLRKKSGADYDTEWGDASSGGGNVTKEAIATALGISTTQLDQLSALSKVLLVNDKVNIISNIITQSIDIMTPFTETEIVTETSDDGVVITTFRYPAGSDKLSQCGGIFNIPETLDNKQVIGIGYSTLGSPIHDNDNILWVIVPNTIKSISNNAFKNCSNLNRFSFNGTMDEWASISKGTSWKQNSPFTKVQCTDGTVSV